MEVNRHVVSLKLLGKEQNKKTPKVEVFAIEVELSDESVYTVYRCKKEIALFNHKVINRFQDLDSELILPDCPLKKTPFGIKQANNDENQLGRLLYNYFKKFSCLPANVIKSDTVMEFASLAPSDMEINNENKKKKKRARIPKRNESLRMTSTARISKPMLYKSYIAIADFNGKRLRFKKDTILQVLQKDPRGWWLVDIHGELGWAPASFLVLRDGDDVEAEEEENEALIQQDKVGARYISTLSYKASRDDEISFATGIIVRVIKKYIDGWWLVKYNGREGFVPGSNFKKFDRRQATTYVKNIKRKYTQRKTTCVRRSPATGSVNNVKRTNEADNNANAVTKTDTIAVYECVAKFIGREERHEISLNRGDIVQVLEMKDNGWWYVQDWHGLSGWVSSSFLKDVHDGLNTSESIKKKIGTQCEVVSAFDGQSENELTIKKGDIVTVLLVSDDGWWRVRLANDDGTDEEGLVPSVCLSDKINKKTRHTDQTSNGSANSTGMIVSVSNTEDTGSVSVIPVGDKDDVFDDSSYWTGSDNSDDFKDCYIVARDYIKQSFDEVDALEGEIACVIDHTQKDVWYVEIDNREGWIPSNMLRQFTDKELNNSLSCTPESTPETTPPPPPDEVLVTQWETVQPREITVSQSSEESHHLCVVSVSSDEGLSDDNDQHLPPKDNNDDEMGDLEKALAEAERIAREANEKAATLRKLAEDKKSNSTMMGDKMGSNGTKIKRELLVERLV